MLLLLLGVTPLVAATTDDCTSLPRTTVSTSANADPALTAKDSALLNGFLSDELVALLKDASSDEKTWDAAVRNPDAFLKDHGFFPPDGVSVALLQRPNGHSYVVWEPICPPGLKPVTTTTTVRVCDLQVSFWVCHDLPDGGFICTLMSMCLREHWENQTTTFCALDVVIGGKNVPHWAGSQSVVFARMTVCRLPEHV